jgi:hypothetical protein
MNSPQSVQFGFEAHKRYVTTFLWECKQFRIRRTPSGGTGFGASTNELSVLYSGQVQLATFRFGWRTGFERRVGGRIKDREYDVNRASLVFLALAFLSGCTDRITPVEMTRTAMTETLARINIYAQTNKGIPPSLDVLAKRDGYVNRTTDGWNRPLQYRVTQDGIGTLMSLGADGKAGGNGDDADISVSYRSKRPDGSLWVGSPTWLFEAEVK